MLPVCGLFDYPFPRGLTYFHSTSGILPVSFRHPSGVRGFMKEISSSAPQANTKTTQKATRVVLGPLWNGPHVHKWQLTRMSLAVRFRYSSGDGSVSNAGPESRSASGLQGRLRRPAYPYRKPPYPYIPCPLRPDVVVRSRQSHRTHNILYIV